MGFWFSNVTHLLLAAQTVLVPVGGRVRDAESGAPLSAAIVSLTGLQRRVSTDDLGRYAIEVPPGIQHVVVQRFGYTAQAFDALIPESGTLEINIELRRDPILLEPIEVRAPVAIRGLDNAATSLDFPDRTVSQAAMYANPLSAEPDPLRAVSGAEVAIDPESPSGLHIRGGASDQVAYLIDGIPVFSPYRTGGTFSSWNPDALASVDLIAASPAYAAPDALSGVVSANTRAPGERFQTRGSVSATQARASIDGPFGRSGAGYLMSVGSAFPGLIIDKKESSHLQGDNVDWLGKLEAPLFGGRARMLGYGSRTNVDSSPVSEDDTVSVDPIRNTLVWDGRSFGGEWMRPVGERASLVLRAWTAVGEASAAWTVADSLENLASSRREDGLVAMIELAALGGNTTVGTRLQRIETAYSLQTSENGESSLSLTQDTRVSTAFLEHTRPLSTAVQIDLGLASAFALGEIYTAPSAQIGWRASPSLFVSAAAARRHQFAQSLRNSESVVSNIFPADLYVGAGESGIPVAISDMAILALEHRTNAWLRLGAQGYIRDFESVALVAPRSADPYATDGFVVGSGDAYGFSLDAGASREHYGILASYAYEHVQMRYGDGDYVPNYGVAHRIQAGLVLTPASSYSVRLGFQGAMGRRTTATLGTLEWEACNMLDGGCEFAGSPSEWSGSLGGTELPAYFRLDVGLRKQWDVKLGGRDGHLAAFGTATNLLAHKNVLTVAVDPSTGRRSDVEMLPPSPLVVGIDWRF